MLPSVAYSYRRQPQTLRRQKSTHRVAPSIAVPSPCVLLTTVVKELCVNPLYLYIGHCVCMWHQRAGINGILWVFSWRIKKGWGQWMVTLSSYFFTAFISLQCFYTVGWMTGKASHLQKLALAVYLRYFCFKTTKGWKLRGKWLSWRFL